MGDDIMVIKRLPPKIIEKVIQDTIPAGGEAHSDLELADVISLAVTAKINYPSTCSAGVIVYLLTSPDGTNYDNENLTDAFAHFSPQFVAGETHQRTINVDLIPRYLRILVRNPPDASCTCSAIVSITKVYNEVS